MTLSASITLTEAAIDLAFAGGIWLAANLAVVVWLAYRSRRSSPTE